MPSPSLPQLLHFGHHRHQVHSDLEVACFVVGLNGPNLWYRWSMLSDVHGFTSACAGRWHGPGSLMLPSLQAPEPLPAGNHLYGPLFTVDVPNHRQSKAIVILIGYLVSSKGRSGRAET